MNKKSIGQFLAALRKANGMTQQEVADKLNVSNKAISRWERDECAPDLSLIPALAEMFGVTCDELLKGERIFDTVTPEKSEPKVEKQLKALINRTVSRFKTTILISLALAITGYICMLGISYGFYRPIIGFAVMMLFETSAVIVATVAINKMKEIKTDNELFENADSSLTEVFYSTLEKLTFLIFFIIFSAISLSLPLLIFKHEHYIDSVLSAQSYFCSFVPFITLALVLVYFTAKEPFNKLILGSSSAVIKSRNPRVHKLNCMQLSAVSLAGFLFLVFPYFQSDPGTTSVLEIALPLTALVLLLFDFIIFFYYIIRYANDRLALSYPGLRNVLLVIPVFGLSRVQSTGFYSATEYMNGYTSYKKIIDFSAEIFWANIALALLIFVVFKIIDVLTKKKTA